MGLALIDRALGLRTSYNKDSYNNNNNDNNNNQRTTKQCQFREILFGLTHPLVNTWQQNLIDVSLTI